MSNGIIYSGTGTLSLIPAENVAVISAVSTVNGNVVLIGTGVTTAPLKVRFYATPNGSSIVAVKLELGSVSTLANDPPADYATELLKCMRYYEKSDETWQGDSTWGNGRLSIPFKVRKRITPTISITGIGTIGNKGPDHFDIYNTSYNEPSITSWTADAEL